GSPCARAGLCLNFSISDVTGLTVRVPVVKEATALGCAIAAGVGAGLYASLAETGEQLVRWEREHQPDLTNHARYQEQKENWRRGCRQ
ncbi:hypothetical protein ISX56_33580, partial [Serratia ureilytica]|nr:hypothetical protein [Serratia ureilytica]